MSNPKCYLAGGISGLGYEEATNWRDTAHDELKTVGIDAFSPLRDKEFLIGSQDLTWDQAMAENPMATSKGILARDRNDCCTADALLVNLKGLTKVSLGTAFELAWAYHLHIPTVVIAESDNIHVVHPMAREMLNFRVDTLAEGLVLIKTLLLPRRI